MKKYYIKPQVECMNIATENSLLLSSKPEEHITTHFDSKHNNGGIEEIEDDEADWDNPIYLKPKF